MSQNSKRKSHCHDSELPEKKVIDVNKETNELEKIWRYFHSEDYYSDNSDNDQFDEICRFQFDEICRFNMLDSSLSLIITNIVADKKMNHFTYIREYHSSFRQH